MCGSAFPSALALPTQATQAFAFDSLLAWDALSLSSDILWLSAPDSSLVNSRWSPGINQTLLLHGAVELYSPF